MQNLKQSAKLNLFSASVLAVLSMLALFSCSKNSSEITTGDKEPALSNSSNAIHERYGSVAVPFEATVFVPCANGGAGENVALSGEMNFVYQLTWTDNGFSMVFHDNSYGVTGVGLSSGETFVASAGGPGVSTGSLENRQGICTAATQL